MTLPFDFVFRMLTALSQDAYRFFGIYECFLVNDSDYY